MSQLSSGDQNAVSVSLTGFPENATEEQLREVVSSKCGDIVAVEYWSSASSEWMNATITFATASSVQAALNTFGSSNSNFKPAPIKLPDLGIYWLKGLCVVDPPQHCETLADLAGMNGSGCTESHSPSTEEKVKENEAEVLKTALEKESQKLKEMVHDIETRCIAEKALDAQAKQASGAESRHLEELKVEMEQTKALCLETNREKEKSYASLVELTRQGTVLAEALQQLLQDCSVLETRWDVSSSKDQDLGSASQELANEMATSSHGLQQTLALLIQETQEPNIMSALSAALLAAGRASSTACQTI